MGEDDDQEPENDDPRPEIEPQLVWDVLMPPGWEPMTPREQSRFPHAELGQTEGLS